MITADKLKELVELDRRDLARVLADSGYTGMSFEDAEFLGITNGGQFCYSVTYWDDGGGPEEVLDKGKVFVRYDHSTHALSADF